MKDWSLVAKIAAVSVIALTVGLFAWWLVPYLQQKPWPPELSGPGGSLQAGDIYEFRWEPAQNGPMPELYILEKSKTPIFSSPDSERVKHQGPQAAPQWTSPQVASAEPSTGTTYYCRIIAGYRSKYFTAGDILSDPSNVVSYTVAALPNPSLTPVSASVFSGEKYTVSWTQVAKANEYRLEEVQPDYTVKTHRLSSESKEFTAPPNSQNVEYRFRVLATNASGGTPTPITNWSNQGIVTVNHVSPPTAIQVSPASVYFPQQYIVSWDAPSVGPQPTSEYRYMINDTPSSGVQSACPIQSTRECALVAPLVSSNTTIKYQVMAYFGNNPMTNYSSPPVSVAISAPPPPPPPRIDAVVPDVQARGNVIRISGANFSGNCGDNIVRIGGVPATASNCNASSLDVTVPDNAPYGLRTLTVETGSQISNAVQVTVARQPGSFVEITSEIKGQTASIPCTSSEVKVDICTGNCPGHLSGAMVAYYIKVPSNTRIGPDISFYPNYGTLMGIGGAGFSLCSVGIVWDGDASAYSAEGMSLSFLDLENGTVFGASPYTFNRAIPGPPHGTYEPRILRSIDGTVFLISTAATTGPAKVTAALIDKEDSGNVLAVRHYGQWDSSISNISAVITTDNKIVMTISSMTCPSIGIP